MFDLLRFFALIPTLIEAVETADKPFAIQDHFSALGQSFNLRLAGTLSNVLPAGSQISKVNFADDLWRMVGEMSTNGSTKEDLWYEISAGNYVATELTLTRLSG